jgi:putative addiction module component (TIGR02574 family)
MANPLRSVTADAMALDPADRLRLASDLLDSVEEHSDDGWAEAWSQELDRRMAEADKREAQGQPRGSDWSEVHARLLRSLAQR